MMATYIYGEMNKLINTKWNVLVYKKQDWNTMIFMTGLWDAYHPNKRYYQTFEPSGANFCVIICETNNTSKSTHFEPTEMIQALDQPKQTHEIPEGLTYVKKKSDSVSAAQEAGIDLAMTTAYTWNKNIVDFTHVAQGFVSTNLS